MNEKIRVIAGSLAIAGLMMANPVSADVPLTLNAGVAQWVFDSDRGMSDTTTPWVSLEYAFDDNWAAELFYADDSTRLDGGAGGSVDVTTWQIDMLYYGGSYIGESNRIRPYLAVGAGEIDYDGGTFDTVETTVNVGAGLRWMFTDRLGMRLEARVLHSLDEVENDILVSAGLNYYFGNVTAPAAPVAVVAVAVDSDGDGVNDDMDQCPNTSTGTRVDSVGCALPVKEIASIKLKVNFGFDSNVVGDQYFSDVNELAAFLKRFSDLQVSVEGHTDSVGPEDYNQQLSQSRAQAVVDLLVNEHGVASNRLEAKGYGESTPVASNDTKEGRAENRRVMATLEVEYSK
jgi:OOP family OmpA-OmpF porin